MNKEISPNIEIFNAKVRALGLELDDTRISERQLFKAYSEGLEPTLDKILMPDTDSDQDEMEIASPIF